MKKYLEVECYDREITTEEIAKLKEGTFVVMLQERDGKNEKEHFCWIKGKKALYNSAFREHFYRQLLTKNEILGIGNEDSDTKGGYISESTLLEIMKHIKS